MGNLISALLDEMKRPLQAQYLCTRVFSQMDFPTEQMDVKKTVWLNILQLQPYKTVWPALEVFPGKIRLNWQTGGKIDWRSPCDARTVKTLMMKTVGGVGKLPPTLHKITLHENRIQNTVSGDKETLAPDNGHAENSLHETKEWSNTEELPTGDRSDSNDASTISEFPV